MKKILKRAFTVFLSGLVGFVNGFFGGGGGMLCVPMLEKLLKLPTKKAHATAIMVIAPITALSAVAYFTGGAVPFEKLPIVIVGVLAGGVLGAVLLKKLPPLAVGAIFAIMMIAVGVKMAVAV